MPFRTHYRELTHWPLGDFKLILVNGGWGIYYETAFRWMLLDLTDDKSTLVQVMTWCRQAKSHYLSQCWLRSMSPNGVTRPQRVKWSSEVSVVKWHGWRYVVICKWREHTIYSMKYTHRQRYVVICKWREHTPYSMKYAHGWRYVVICKWQEHTIYSMKYAHGWRYVVICKWQRTCNIFHEISTRLTLRCDL